LLTVASEWFKIVELDESNDRIQRTDADSAIANALCIRYLAGILELPGFWMNIGSVRKPCVEMVRIFRDISIDILPSEELPRSEAPFDYDGVDSLADAILVGISSWLRQMNPTKWPLQPWYLYFREGVRLLRGAYQCLSGFYPVHNITLRPIPAAFLPKSFSRATSDSLEEDIPTIYREVELDIMVELQPRPSHIPFRDLVY
jgi:hypothetical protein